MMHEALAVTIVTTLCFVVPAPVSAFKGRHKVSHHRRASFKRHHQRIKHRRLHRSIRSKKRHRRVRPRHQRRRPHLHRHSLRGLFNAGLGARQAQPKPKPLTQLTIQVDKGNVQISDSAGKMKRFDQNEFRLYRPVWDAVRGAMVQSKDPAVRRLASSLEAKNDQLPFWFQQQALPRTLVEVLTNSLRAVRSTSKGSGKISVTAEVVKDNFVLSVKDSGVGLGGVDRKKLFGEGYTTKEHNPGNVGLGLHYSKRVVQEMYKGKIEGLDNRTDLKAGAGATFRISIPLRQPAESGSGNERAAQTGPVQGYSPPGVLLPGVHY